MTPDEGQQSSAEIWSLQSPWHLVNALACQSNSQVQTPSLATHKHNEAACSTPKYSSNLDMKSAAAGPASIAVWFKASFTRLLRRMILNRHAALPTQHP